MRYVGKSEYGSLYCRLLGECKVEPKPQVCLEKLGSWLGCKYLACRNDLPKEVHAKIKRGSLDPSI